MLIAKLVYNKYYATHWETGHCKYMSQKTNSILGDARKRWVNSWPRDRSIDGMTLTIKGVASRLVLELQLVTFVWP